MKKIAVIGSGTMGSGIAQVIAESKFDVLFYDANTTFLEKGLATIEKNLNRKVEKNRITKEEAEAAIARVQVIDTMDGLQDADVVIEAVTEQMEVKKELFSQLDAICKAETIFVTNTSGLSITEMANAVKRSEQVVGIHFFNPVPVMKLVEIIKAEQTSQATLDVAQELAEKLNKKAIMVEEAPLFVVNRILVPMLNEAIFVLSEGIASAEDIDEGMKLGANHPIGPLALSDLIGLDTLLHVVNTLYDETKDSKYRPAPLLVKYVRAGKLGRKTGEGFYKY